MTQGLAAEDVTIKDLVKRTHTSLDQTPFFTSRRERVVYKGHVDGDPPPFQEGSLEAVLEGASETLQGPMASQFRIPADEIHLWRVQAIKSAKFTPSDFTPVAHIRTAVGVPED